MIPVPSRRRRVAVPFLAAIAIALAPPAHAGAQAAEPTATAPAASMRVDFQTDHVAPDGDFSMLLRLTDAPVDGDLVVRIYDRIEDRAGLDAARDGDPDSLRDTFDPVDLPSTGGATRTGFTINLWTRGQQRPPGAWAYRLDEAGVYPIEVRIRDRDDGVVTSLVTFLVREPDADDDPATPSPVAVIATVHAAPARSHAARLAEDRADPRFLRRLDPRLAAFAEEPDVPASFAVTPDNALQLAGDPGADARSTLAALRAELARPDRELLGGPYVDVDPAQLVHDGLADELARQRDLGIRTLTTALQAPVADTWAVDHRLDDAAVQALRQVGAQRLVVSSSILADEADGVATLTTTGAGVTALPVDPAADLGTVDGDPVLVAHQLLGELAAAGSIGTEQQVLAVRVDALTVDPTALKVLLGGLADPTSFLRPTTASGALDRAPGLTAAARLRRPTWSDEGGYPERSRLTHARVASYGSMVPDRPQLAQAYDRPLAIAAASDLALRRRNLDLDRIRADVDRRFAAITAAERDQVTLGASDASFPLVIHSTLDHPVQVVIELSSSDRLQFPDDRIEATITDERTVIPIKVHTRGSGATPLTITTRTPDGQVILTTTRYTVRSTAVSGVGIVLSVGAGLFLAAWWGRHWYRNRVRARHARPRFARRHPDPM